MTAYIQETRALTRRWWQRFRREPTTMIFGLVQPVLWLVLFGNLFQKATTIPGVAAPSYIAFMTAGVVVMTILNSGLAGGIEMLFDRETGVLERLMAAPIRRSTLITSRFLFVMGITSLQALLILAAAFLFGVRTATGLGGVAMILLIGLLLGVGLISLSIALAFSIKSHGAFFAFLGFISLPLIFLSSALAPLATMPAWLRLLAELNPMTYTIEAVRALVLKGWIWGLVAQVVAVLLFFDAVCLWIGARILRRTLG